MTKARTLASFDTNGVVRGSPGSPGALGGWDANQRMVGAGINGSEVARLSGAQTLNDKTLANPAIDGSVTEDVFDVTGTTPVLDAANGTIQTWTLTANSTPTINMPAGQSLTLMVADGASAFTVNWASAVGSWVGGEAPVLPETGFAVITLWAVGGVVYGAHMGDTA